MNAKKIRRRAFLRVFLVGGTFVTFATLACDEGNGGGSSKDSSWKNSGCTPEPQGGKRCGNDLKGPPR